MEERKEYLIPLPTLFDEEDIGCYVDNSYDNQHRRNVLCDMMRSVGCERIAEELEKEMFEDNDDAYEELEALEVLQSFTKEGLVWELDNGELFLRELEEE